MKGLNLITYLDGASRCVTGAALFQEAVPESVVVLRQAVGRFGVLATILLDNCSCFVGSKDRKKPTGAWAPTPLENRQLVLCQYMIGIVLLSSFVLGTMARGYSVLVGRRT